jgi:hypothetical protein
MMLTKKFPHTPFYIRVTAVFGIFLILVAIWLPFGMKTTAAVEEWDLYWVFDSGQDVLEFNARVFTTRPLFILPTLLGYLFSPGSFFGLNFVLLALFLLKSTLLYAVTKQFLPRHGTFAFLAAILFVLYPADDGIFALRAVGHQFAMAFWLLGTHLLIRFWHKQNRAVLIGMVCAAAVSVLSYEAMYPLVLLTPAGMLWFEKRISRRVIAVGLAWYAVLLLTIVWAVIRTSQLQSTYILTQVEMTGSALTLNENIRAILASIVRAYERNFISGWLEISGYPILTQTFLSSAAVTGVITLGVAWLHQMVDDRLSINLRRYVTVLIVGIAIVGVGFSVFSLSVAHRNETIRVFLFSSVGAAIAITAAVYLISYRLPLGNIVFACITTLLIVAAAVNAMARLQQLSDYSELQEGLLFRITEQAPALELGTTVVVFDPDEVFRYNPSVSDYGNIINFGLKYIYANYADSLTGLFCYPDNQSYANQLCTLEADGVHLTSSTSPSMVTVYPYNQIVAFTYERGEAVLLDEIPDEYLLSKNSAETYDPHQLIDQDAPLPVHAYSVFNWNEPDTLPPAQLSLNFDFNIDVPGTGWSVPQGSQTWTDQAMSRIYTRLVPQDFTIQARIVGGITAQVLDSLRLRVNDQSIELTYSWDQEGARVYQGIIPAEIISLNSEETVLTFEVDEVVSPASLGMNDDPRTLGILFDWLRIEPLTP